MSGSTPATHLRSGTDTWGPVTKETDITINA